ncbi:MAG: hypothetical protein LBP53_01955 [Candidatus Peribacteria bacterium]|jgi:hypothetical protein|nr:hypothetical protein [Candidatus Peribacteria bacterium]
MKKLIMFTITLLVSVPVVLADVLPEYTTKEKLVGVEMTANVADYPEWVFFQRVANYDTNKLISELLGDDGTLGCNRSNYINELLAVKATSPEDKQYLIYEWNTHRKQLQQLINIQKSIEQLRNSYHYADWLDDALFDNLQIQIDNVHSHIENKEKDFLYFLASKGAIQLFSGKNFREL